MVRIRTQTSYYSSSKSKLCVGGSCNALVSRVVLHTRDTCEDEVALGDGHYFKVDRVEYSGTTGTYFVNTGTYNGSFMEDWIPDYCSTKAATWGSPPVPSYSRPTNGALAAQLLAETNPSRPVVDLPIFLFELRELPSLIKKFGDRWHKNLADANLRYQFGLRPLIADLTALLDFQGEVNKRYLELKALQEGGLRRKRSLYTYSNNTSVGIPVLSSGFPSGNYAGKMDTRIDVDVSGFVKWIPSTNFPKTDHQLRSLATRAVLGLTVDFSTAWNALPWSWLIDWFSSVGDFLAAQRNLIPVTHSTPLIMEQRIVTYVISGTSGGAGFAGVPGSAIPRGPWTIKKTLKNRYPTSASISAHLPGLSLRQLSILGSIGVQRYR